ncbi:MAG: transporter substrate-binding domain-containing protein [Proteobacteria bacterium]|nr:transporter substrate-binding domain-containing protein [Pseudomonadota bacterium]
MKFLLSLILIFFMGVTGYCDAPLKVGVVVNPPFVIKNEATYSGIAIDLWNEVAQGLGRPYVFIEHVCNDADKPFEILQKGEFDVLVGALSITGERYEKVDFTLPFFMDKVIAITPSDYIHNIILFLRMFLVSTGSIIGVLILLFLVYIHLLWYYERSHSKSFPRNYREGVTYLFWHHIISGRHFEIPVSFAGRLVVLFQKSLFYFIIILLNATWVSFITVTFVKYASSVQCISDLEKRKIGAIEKSKSFKAGTNIGLRVIPFKSLDEGLIALEEGHLEAFLEEQSTAEIALSEKGIGKLVVSQFSITRDLYSFATRVGSPLLREINTQILRLRRKEVPEKICKTYLPRAVKNCEF